MLYSWSQIFDQHCT